MNAIRCGHFHPDCFQYVGGYCRLLNSQINKADCPFYKTVTQNDKDKETAHKHLVDIERFDLVEKFEHNILRSW